MAKVLNIVESEVKQIQGKSVQRVIFSDDKIVYVDIYTGEVRPESTPDKYVDLISIYNASHRPTSDQALNDSYQDKHESTAQTEIPEKAAKLRRAAANVDLVFVILIGFFNLILLFTDPDNIGWAAISLIWMIPMTVVTYRSANDNSDRTALGVCHLIFFSIISGVLILKSNKYIND